MPLREILRALIISAEAAQGRVVASKLPKGLGIRLMLKDDLMQVQLHRDKVSPSAQEWKTVMQCWPEPLHVEQEPKPLTPQGERHFLRGALRRAQSLIVEGAADGKQLL